MNYYNLKKMGNLFDRNKKTNEVEESYQTYEGNIDIILIDSLENVFIILGLIVIITIAIALIINYIKNNCKRKKEGDAKNYYNNNYNYNKNKNYNYNNYNSNKNSNNIFENKNNIINNSFYNNYNNRNLNINKSNDYKKFDDYQKRNKKKKNYEMNEINSKNNNFNNNSNNNFKIINNNFKTDNININNNFYNKKTAYNFSNNIINNNDFNFNINLNNDNNIINNNNNTNNNTILYNNNDNNIDTFEDIGFISSNIEEEPKIGLANIGATCYMNATLQCMSHTIKLSNFFLNKKNEKKIKSKNFSKAFLEVIKRLWIKAYNKNKNYYEPYNFKNIISDMNPLFRGIAANDSKDLINFILEELHRELNNVDEKQGNNQLMEVNQSDEQQLFLYFLEDFKKNYRSIISDIFFFIIETKTECLNCKMLNQMKGIYNPIYLYNFQVMNFLIFPLEEVRKFKIMQYQQNFNEVNLYDCFIYNQKIDCMQGENQMWCKNCKQNSPTQYMSCLYSSPIDLILILNRGKGNIYNVKLNFEEIIDIGNFVTVKKSKNLIYHLYAIVTHIGPSNMGGHFIAFCKSPIDNNWYKYNDAMVDYVGDFYKDILNFGVPYILFYESQNI